MFGENSFLILGLIVRLHRGIPTSPRRAEHPHLGFSPPQSGYNSDAGAVGCLEISATAISMAKFSARCGVSRN